MLRLCQVARAETTSGAGWQSKTSAETFGRKVGLGLGPVELQRGVAFQPKSKVSSVTDAEVGSGRPRVWVRGPESPIPVSGNDGSSYRV